MIHVIIDTNIYRKSPRLDSPEFKSVSYMAKKHCIQLHVPYVVEREFSTFLEQEQRKRITSAVKSISAATNFEGNGKKTEELLEQLKSIQANAEELVNERSKAFVDWLESNHAESQPLTLEQSNNALEAYFNGDPPLKEAKIRRDIPDSFIFQSILELKEKYDYELQVIIEDGALREACAGENITAFSSISCFLESDEAQEWLKRKLFDDNKNQISQYVHDIAKSEIDVITDRVEEILLTDDYRMISGNKIPGENGEIYVSLVNRPRSVVVEDVEYFGAGLFVAYFIAIAELTYEYPVYYTDSFELDRDKFYIQPLNERYVEVETTDEFQFIGRAELDFGESIDDIDDIDKLIIALKEPSISISELEDFEINA